MPLFLESFLTKYALIKNTKKPRYFYQYLDKLYLTYPITGSIIIRNLWKLGSYKDYLYLIKYSTNPALIEILYSFFQSKISDPKVCRYFPRENSRIDKSINFVDKFCTTLFPNVKNKFQKRKMYRKMLVSYRPPNADLTSLSIFKLMKCYKKTPPNIFHPILRSKLLILNIWQFGRHLYRYKGSNMVIRDVFESVLLENMPKFQTELNELSLYHPEKHLLLDTSVDMEPYKIYYLMIIIVNGYKSIRINFRSEYVIRFGNGSGGVSGQCSDPLLSPSPWDIISKIDENILPSSSLYPIEGCFIITNKPCDLLHFSPASFHKHNGRGQIKTNIGLINKICDNPAIYIELYLVKCFFFLVIFVICEVIFVYKFCC